MTATAMQSYEPGTPEWMKQRARRIGGSEISAVLGFSPWQSPFSLWHQKNGQWGGEADNDGMEWGRRLEAAIASKWADNHSDVTCAPGGTWVSIEHPFALASPDRLVNDDQILEVKTARFGDDWGEPGTDQIPLWYRMQCLWYLRVLGLNVCHVAVLIGGADYREYVIRIGPQQNAEIEEMIRAARQFIETLNTGERPAIDDHAMTYQVIKELHPDIEPEDVELPADLARDYCTARATLKDAKASEQRAASLVADHMGNARRATFLGDTIATRQARGDGTPYLVAGRNLPNFDPKAA